MAVRHEASAVVQISTEGLDACAGRGASQPGEAPRYVTVLRSDLEDLYSLLNALEQERRSLERQLAFSVCGLGRSDALRAARAFLGGEANTGQEQ